MVVSKWEFSMTRFFDDKEISPRSSREQVLMAKLPEQIAYAKQSCEHYGVLLADFKAEQVTSLDKLALLPVTRKSALIDLQMTKPPFAGLVAGGSQIARAFQSPGPINDPEGEGDDWWRMGRAFHAAGFRAGDLVQNCLSYHLTPGGFIMDSGARACGCTVIPAGPGQTEQQLEVLTSLKPSGYCGTPSFLNILLDKAKEQQRDISFLTKALVTGEPFPESLRKTLAEKGVKALQAYATADIGLVAYESENSPGMIVAEDLIVEVVRPGTGQPVIPGEVGEILVTNFNREYPLIRFATGDMTAVLPGESDCGRTNMRIKGWLGRADQTTKVKGMFVHPQQVEKVRQLHPDINKARLVITNENHNDVMTFIAEVNADSFTSDALSALKVQIQTSIKATTKLTAIVDLVNIGVIENDGMVIKDKRSFD